MLTQSRIIPTRSRGAFGCRVVAMASAPAKLGPTRNLHWVFKVGDRTATTQFYTDVLGMTTLRHEEFEEGCAAACNGPYDGKWSKTMIGYGPEDSQFVLELTYNYGVKSYELGNDYRHIVVRKASAYDACRARGLGTPVSGYGAPALAVSAPGGYGFVVVAQDAAAGATVMTELCLSCSDLDKSLAFWSGFLGFAATREGGEAVVSCGPGQATLRLVQLPAGTQLERGTAFGRVAFATPGGLLQQLETDVLAAGCTVHTRYVSLDTPGKATVQVVILQDPDGHEICFVGDEGFRQLSQVDPAAPQLLSDAVAGDKSAEWFEKQKLREAAMAAKGG
mmetsp:Transcript_23119/g.59063  ORF Transcript_23119/g.59063 Transcript_23119/m.59063 type:complete len:335 (-) Transcript_23119:9-1013(-)